MNLQVCTLCYTVAAVCGLYHRFTFKQTWGCKHTLIKMYVWTRCLSVLQTEYRFTPAGCVGCCYSLHGKTDCCCRRLHHLCYWTQAFDQRTKVKLSFQAPFWVFAFVPHKVSNRAKQLQAKPVQSCSAVRPRTVRENFFPRASLKRFAD